MWHDPLAFLAGGGEMGTLIRAFDWSVTPLGPIESWPGSLRTTVSICLNSDLPARVFVKPIDTETLQELMARTNLAAVLPPAAACLYPNDGSMG